MKTKDVALGAGMERLNALMGWWGVPMPGGHGMIDEQIKRFQQCASDMQKTCGDAYSGQMEVLFSSNERLVHSFQDLLRSRRPQEMMAAETEILATLLEGASSQAKRWVELTEKLQDCCAAMAREAAENLRQQAQETVAAQDGGKREPFSVTQTPPAAGAHANRQRAPTKETVR